MGAYLFSHHHVDEGWRDRVECAQISIRIRGYPSSLPQGGMEDTLGPITKDR